MSRVECKIYYYQKMTTILYVVTIKTWKFEKLNVTSFVINKNLNLQYDIDRQKRKLLNLLL